MSRIDVLACVLVAVTACGSAGDPLPHPGGEPLATVPGPPAPPEPGPAASAEPSPAAPAGPLAAAYDPASGRFVVHEWGTFTHVVGSDGSVQPGLHHEDEDLPGFVADRMAQAQVTPDLVRQKMETPVTYFYAPAPRRVSVKVGFPQGIFTQWFPYVRQTLPPLYRDVSISPDVLDPWISSAAPVPERCRPRFQAFRDGLLDWGEVDVLPRGFGAALPGPLGETTWALARNTAANPIRVTVAGRAYEEKFLFYRGLGDFELPLRLRVEPDGVVRLANTDPAHPLRGVLLLNVDGPPGARKGSMTEVGDIVPGATARGVLLPAGEPLPALLGRVRRRLLEALAHDGLYQDEATAMIDTWERSYFHTPGPRVFYLLPQARTDVLLPLTVAPRPDELRRSMVIRVELITPEAERRNALALARLASAAAGERAAARQFFLGLGRFAEPQLSRALALSSSRAERQAGEALLLEIRARRRWAPLAAE